MSCPNLKCQGTPYMANGRGASAACGTDQKYELYYPENACLFPSSTEPVPNRRNIPYPLANIPSCKMPCLTKPDMSIYGNPVASDLYGDALAMNGGDGMFYDHDLNANLPMSMLTYTGINQPVQMYEIPRMIKRTN